MRGQKKQEDPSRHLSSGDLVPQINFICRISSTSNRYTEVHTKFLISSQKKIMRVSFKNNTAFNTNNMVCGKNTGLRIHTISLPKSATAMHSRQSACASLKANDHNKIKIRKSQHSHRVQGGSHPNDKDFA